MAKQIFWEEVEIGSEVPPLVKTPTTQQLVKWAGASGDYSKIHFDKDFALERQLPNVIVQGSLKSAWFGQLLSDWVGEKGKIIKYSCTYRGMDVPGDTLTIRGKITKKYVKDKEHLVEAEIWLQNGKGEKTTSGTGLVVLPSR